ncbi:MAG: hypothetical protein ACI87E_003616 [Mariniblastus sp.]|jgi:hypothetical protein
MGLVAATKAFCKLLFNRQLSDSFQEMLDGKLQPRIAATKPTPAVPAPKPAAPARSDAISLLAALQREARLLDIVNESLDAYSDEQVGAAARDVLRDSGKVIKRMFAVVRLSDADDGSALETPKKFDPAEFRLTGNVTGEAPFHGTVAHHGWKATKCEVPKWTGSKSTSLILAPVELEIG